MTRIQFCHRSFRLQDAAAEAEWQKYPPIKKEFYRSHKEVIELTDEQVATFREENNNIVVDRTFKKGTNRPIPKPCPQFYHAFFDYPEILEEIRKAGFEKPSPIQAQAWPVLLSGEDLIGIAQTGTGKWTLIYEVVIFYVHLSPSFDQNYVCYLGYVESISYFLENMQEDDKIKIEENRIYFLLNCLQKIIIMKFLIYLFLSCL